MAKYCGKCGSKLDPETGLCPKCHIEETKGPEETKRKGRPSKMVLLGIVCIAVIAIGLIYFGKGLIPGVSRLFCQHTWQEAACTQPQTCARCGKTAGEALGHDWQDATCTEPKTCSRCGETEGTAMNHDWKEATCTLPSTCKRCGETEGEANGHVFSETNFSTETDVINCIMRVNAPCLYCDEVDVEEIELTSFIMLDGNFGFTAKQFMERLEYINKDYATDISYQLVPYEFSDLEFLLMEMYVDETLAGVINFLTSPNTYLTEDGYETDPLFAVSYAPTNDMFWVNTFVMACDPSLTEEDAEMTVSRCISSVSVSDGIGSQHGILYETVLYPNSTVKASFTLHPDVYVAS